MIKKYIISSLAILTVSFNFNISVVKADGSFLDNISNSLHLNKLKEDVSKLSAAVQNKHYDGQSLSKKQLDRVKTLNNLFLKNKEKIVKEQLNYYIENTKNVRKLISEGHYVSSYAKESADPSKYYLLKWVFITKNKFVTESDIPLLKYLYADSFINNKSLILRHYNDFNKMNFAEFLTSLYSSINPDSTNTFAPFSYYPFTLFQETTDTTHFHYNVIYGLDNGNNRLQCEYFNNWQFKTNGLSGKLLTLANKFNAQAKSFCDKHKND